MGSVKNLQPPASQKPRPVWVFLSEMAGQIAMWAIRQSPYDGPENLDVVLKKFQAKVRGHFVIAQEHKGGMRSFESISEIEEFLEEHLFQIPEFRAWNEPKSKHGRLLGFVSPHFGPGAPDDDFIDIWALARNVGMGIFAENYLKHSDSEP